MTGSESYLLEAGWVFFAAWSLVVVTVGVIAFAKDFMAIPSLFESQQQRPVASSDPSTGRTRL